MPPYQKARYINDFNLQGRTYQVYLQADAQFQPALGIGNLYVRSDPIK